MRAIQASLSVLLVTALCIAFAPSNTKAQAVQGSLFGTIKDPAGAAIPGAQVTVKDISTGESRNATSDGTGQYQVSGLPAGAYSITVAQPGFKTFELPQVQLAVGENGRYDVSMQIGTANQTVTVTGEAALIDTTTGAVAQEVTNKQVLELPLNGRSFTDLAQLEPGVVFATAGHSATAEGIAGGRGISLAVNGGNVWDNLWLLDGTLINDNFNKTPGSVSGVILGVDALQEFKVNTSTYGAELSGMGGVVDAVTKSGANDFHGDAFGFWRDKILDSRDFFEPASGALPFVRKQYGGTLGGPIKKNKTFFFLGYEGFRQSSSSVAQLSVPDTNARNGIINGVNVITSPAGFQAIQPLLNQYQPLPTATNTLSDNPVTGIAVVTGTQPGSVREDYFTGRIDELLSSTLTLFARFTFDQSKGQFFPNATIFPNYAEADHTHGQYLTVGTTKIFSSNLVNRALYGFTRPILSSIDNYLGNAPLSPSIPTRTAIDEPFSVSGLTAAGGNGVEPVTGGQITHQVSDDVTYTKGKHAWKFGANYRNYSWPTFTPLDYDGTWSFSSLANMLNDKGTLLSFMCIAGENLPLAPPTGCTSTETYHQWLMGLYASDEWRIESRVTLTLGLRYEYTSQPTENNNLESWLPTPFTPGETAIDTVNGEWWQNAQDYRDFMPRLGVAWDVRGNGKTAVRAGVGIYDESIQEDKYDIWRNSAPQFFLEEIGAQYGTANPTFPCPLNPSVLTFPCPTSGFTLNPNPAGLSRYFTGAIKSPTMYRYSLIIEQQLGVGNSFSVGYIGSLGRHEVLSGAMNLPVPQIVNGQYVFPSITPTQANPGPGCVYVNNCSFGNEPLNGTSWRGNSSYNSLQVSVQHRSNSFLIQGSYTFSKSIDNSSAIHGDDYSIAGGSSVPYWYDLSLGRAPSAFDARHRFAANFTYNVPGPKSGFAAEVLGGWEFTSNFTVQTGSPFTIAGVQPPTAGSTGELYCYSNCTATTGVVSTLAPGATFTNPASFLVLVPGCTRNSMIQPGNAAHYYNPNCVQAATPGVENPASYIGRDQLTGPGLVQINSALLKNLKLTESKSLQFRIEGFNVLNHPNFAGPITAPISYAQSATPINGQNNVFVPVVAKNAGFIGNTIIPGQGGRIVQLGIKFIF